MTSRIETRNDSQSRVDLCQPKPIYVIRLCREVSCLPTRKPKISARCDCGYSFHGRKTSSDSYLRSIDDSRHTIKRIIVWWAVLTVFDFIVWFVATVLSGPNERSQTPPPNKSAEAPAR
jgi:hypothetical protein